MPSSRYVLNEHFYSFQGEGVHMGRAAYFLRLQGCDQACSWCDSAGTWDPKWKNNARLRVGDAKALAGLIDARCEFVVLTGGEPALYDLVPLIDELHAIGKKVHIETAGHKPLPVNVDWVTLSPKPKGIAPLEGSVGRAHEFKIIVEDQWTLAASFEQIKFRKTDAVVWLHPEWSKRDDVQVLDLISETVKKYPGLCRAGYQLHKLYKVDWLDPHADKRVIPLGGGRLDILKREAAGAR